MEGNWRMSMTWLAPPEEYVNVVPSPPPPPSHQPLSPPPTSENGGRAEEKSVYEATTSDPLQYMDWCDVVTVGCLDFPSLGTI